MHGGGTTQLAPVVCEQKYVALQADVVCVGSQSFAHFLFTGFRVFGKDSEASGDSGATRWNSLNPLRSTRESLLTSYVCTHFCVSVEEIFIVLIP